MRDTKFENGKQQAKRLEKESKQHKSQNKKRKATE